MQEFVYRDRVMEKMKCMITPVITEATGIKTKCLKKNLGDGPGKYSIDSLNGQLYVEHHT